MSDTPTWEDFTLRRAFPLLLLATTCARGPTPAGSTTPGVAPAAAVDPEPSPGAAVCRPANSPDTAAGRGLATLVAAVNATDAAAVEKFVASALSAEFSADVTASAKFLAITTTEEFARLSQHQQLVHFIRSMRGEGPSMVLCRAESSATDEVVAILGTAGPEGTSVYEWFILSIDSSGKVASLVIEPASREDLTRPVEKLDDEALRQVVEGVADGLAGYVFADKAAAMAAKIRKARDAGEYAGMTARKLARRLTDDLRAVTSDKHLGVVYSASVLEPPAPGREPTPEEIEQHRKQAAQDNFGMPVAEIREGNVGYLLVLGFLPPELAAEAVAETMSKLADADVLVIDLRQNGGGSPHGVALMTSYLFGSKRVHLNDIYSRTENSTESFYTSPGVPGRKFGPKKPIYVLTSARTFSAGEEFAYNLKARKRATIVGEVTGGGAHPTGFVRVSDHFGIALPNARAINPVTKTNWEGVGVKPNVEVPAEQALDKAMELAAKRKR